MTADPAAELARLDALVGELAARVGVIRREIDYRLDELGAVHARLSEAMAEQEALIKRAGLG